MAYGGPNYWYCDSAQYANVAAWPTSTAKAAGSLVRQNATPTVGNERVFACIVAGTTNSSEPSWTVTKGAKTTDNTVTWQEVTGQPGVNGDTTNSPVWTASSTPGLGLVIYDSTSASLQICTTSAAGSGTKPTFSATAGVTTTDGSAVWTSLGAASNFTKWSAPFARLQSAWTTNWVPAGGVVFLGDDHAEIASSSGLTLTSPGTVTAICAVYCVDHTANVPPTSSNLKTAATIKATGFTISGYAYVYGATFISTSGSIALGGISIKFEASSLQLGSGSGYSSQIVFGSTGGNAPVKFELLNTTLSFNSAGQSVDLWEARLIWRNTLSAIGGVVPANLFAAGTAPGLVAEVTCDGVDLSAAASGKTLVASTPSTSRFTFINCLLGPSVTVAATPGGEGHATTDLINSDSSATGYRQERYWYQGTLTASTSIVRSGGASDGTTAIAWSIATTANVQWLQPFESFPIAIWNSLLSTNRGVTLYGIWNSASLPNNDQIWIDVEYLGSSSSPLASLQTGTKANGLATGTALAADSASTWSSAATARVNSHAYTTGQTIAVADATAGGGLFFCTSGGTSASSEPAGYASASDGGSVTDGTATFRAGTRFALSVTLSSPQPALAGYLRATVKAALASSTFYVDPLINLS